MAITTPNTVPEGEDRPDLMPEVPRGLRAQLERVIEVIDAIHGTRARVQKVLAEHSEVEQSVSLSLSEQEHVKVQRRESSRTERTGFGYSVEYLLSLSRGSDQAVSVIISFLKGSEQSPSRDYGVVVMRYRPSESAEDIIYRVTRENGHTKPPKLYDMHNCEIEDGDVLGAEVQLIGDISSLLDRIEARREMTSTGKSE